MVASRILAGLAAGLLMPRVATSLQRGRGSQSQVPPNFTPITVDEFDSSDAYEADDRSAPYEWDDAYDPADADTGELGPHDDELAEPVHEASGAARRHSHDRRKDHLLYDHMPKAGGTFIAPLLRNAVGRTYFGIRTEFEKLTARDVDVAFTVGSVRNPCNYYLSLWAYGADHGGSMMSVIPRKKRYVYKTTSPNKDSQADIQKFQDWVNMVNRRDFPGIMSVRFAWSYAPVDMDIHAVKPPMKLADSELESVRRSLADPRKFMSRVSCWIRTESMSEDTRTCLETWQNKSGSAVNWDAYARQYTNGRHFESSHGRCADYFTEELAALVMELEAPLFQAFNYSQCCA